MGAATVKVFATKAITMMGLVPPLRLAVAYTNGALELWKAELVGVGIDVDLVWPRTPSPLGIPTTAFCWDNSGRVLVFPQGGPAAPVVVN